MSPRMQSAGAVLGHSQGFGATELFIEQLAHPPSVSVLSPGFASQAVSQSFVLDRRPHLHVSVPVVSRMYYEAKADLGEHGRKWEVVFSRELSRGVAGTQTDLREALADLDECVAEAQEEGVLVPTKETVGRARRLLAQLYAIHPCRFEVYPLHDGEVTIDAPGRNGRSVVLVCEPQGGVLCSVNLDGSHRRAVYDRESAATLPDGFVREALLALDA